MAKKKITTIEQLAELKTFKERYQVDVHGIKGLVEKKGTGSKKFSYISWAFAEQIGTMIWEDFSWNPKINELDGTIVHGDCVIIEMTGGGKQRSYSYPIIDHSNNGCRKDEEGNLRFWKKDAKDWNTKKIIPAHWEGYVTSFDINNAQMRGMSKLFSMMSGIGLGMFTGEDLSIYDQPEIKEDPKTIQQEVPVKQQAEPVKAKTTRFSKARVVNRLNNLAQERIEKLLTHYGVASIDDMSDEQLKDAELILNK